MSDLAIFALSGVWLLAIIIFRKCSEVDIGKNKKFLACQYWGVYPEKHVSEDRADDIAEARVLSDDKPTVAAAPAKTFGD